VSLINETKYFLQVSLFAELFNEMLMRDFGFHVYKHLVSLPEPVKDEEKDKDKKDEKERSSSKDREKVSLDVQT
jgi:hypothetical protein